MELELIVPESWDDVSLNQYVEITKIVKTTDLQYLIDLLLVLIPELKREDVLEFKEEQIAQVLGDYSWLSVLPIELKKEFKVGNDLYVYNKIDKLNMGEMITYETIVKEYQLQNYEVFPLILANILRKKKDGIVEDFNSDIVLERLESFGDEISMGDGYPLVFFFCNGERDYLSDTQDCLEDLMKMKMMIMKED